MSQNAKKIVNSSNTAIKRGLENKGYNKPPVARLPKPQPTPSPPPKKKP